MKPPFDNLNYTNNIFFSLIGGNKIGYIAPLATIITDEVAHEKQFKKDFLASKKIYDKLINRGAKFKASGKQSSPYVKAKITFINPKSETVSWKQYNLDEFKDTSLKPAKGKWLILGMISMIKQKTIEFL